MTVLAVFLKDGENVLVKGGRTRCSGHKCGTRQAKGQNAHQITSNFSTIR
jgi:hypothetical protein